MLIKAGVDISRLKRECRRSLPKVQTVLDEWGDELTITSTYEGVHGEGSLHYADEAYDIGLGKRDPLEVKDLIADELGDAFDVLFEFDHIHIEHDPK